MPTSPRPSHDDPIDRVAPTERPRGLALMHHRWAHLLFLHWPVPVECLRPLVPAGLEVDTFDGHAYVGLIPFTMTGIRPAFVPPIPWFSDSHEVNVRTYVHCNGRDPGVWFFSLDAAHRLAVWGARTFWKLPYYHARMELNVEPGGDPSRPLIAYRSDRVRPEPTPAGCALRYGPHGDVAPARAGTLEHFLIERYILYAGSGPRLYAGRVHHRPYPLQQAEVSELAENLLAAAGISRPAIPPLAHYASEVRVEVFPLRPADRPQGNG